MQLKLQQSTFVEFVKETELPVSDVTEFLLVNTMIIVVFVEVMEPYATIHVLSLLVNLVQVLLGAVGVDPPRNVLKRQLVPR